MDSRGIVACAAVVLSAATVRAQWNPAVWPAWQHLRETQSQLMQTHSGVVERCEAIGVTPPAAPVWWRGQRAALVAQKTALKACLASASHYYLDYYANTNLVSTNPASPTVKLTWAKVAAQARLPTNVLDHTPWRCLAGLGPFTNDVSAVGRMHGWTNAWTMAGGTNYPSGRATWYTTDYGIDVIKAILPYMTHTRIPGDTAGGRRLQYNIEATNTTWAGALADLETQLNNATNWYADETVTEYEVIGEKDYPTDGWFTVSAGSIANSAGVYGTGLGTIGATRRHGAEYWNYAGTDTKYYDFLGVLPNAYTMYRLASFPMAYTNHRQTAELWTNPGAAALPEPAGYGNVWRQELSTMGEWVLTWEFIYE
jgi:hypothetical protein